MIEANKKLHTALWWLALYGGAWFAWQQGWLPFFPPPRPLPQPRTTRSPAASAEPQASAPEVSAPAPLDPATEETMHGQWKQQCSSFSAAAMAAGFKGLGWAAC
ncbi:hypothetical protein HaLaN_11370 [Haematococcus lacustris]|uniref:Uncharacterized protein n=1 Tax=Haematococcus lacustris TaxID=44745 RepID=A0A699Z7P8_HAELA|nr:hypothetical protein HaLaN_11370 [Haematococcus lacustris]